MDELAPDILVDVLDWPEITAAAFGEKIRTKFQGKVCRLYKDSVDVWSEYDSALGVWSNLRTVPRSFVIGTVNDERERRKELRRQSNARSYRRKKAGIEASKCANGHPSSEQMFPSGGRPYCGKCNRERQRAYRLSVQEAA